MQRDGPGSGEDKLSALTSGKPAALYQFAALTLGMKKLHIPSPDNWLRIFSRTSALSNIFVQRSFLDTDARTLPQKKVVK